jgi:tetratricopeptide (TPR) repeat protein
VESCVTLWFLLVSEDNLRLPVRARYRDAAGLHGRGVILAARGELRRSYLFHAAATGVQPDDAGYLHSAGGAALALGLTGDASSYLERALKISPNHAGAWQKRGELYLKLQQPAEGLRSFLRAIEFAPQDIDNYVSASRCLLSDKAASPAIQLLRAALPHAADPLNAERGVAMTLADQGDYEDAVRLFVEVIRRSPDDYTSMRLLAELYTGLREWRNAESCYEQAIAGNDFRTVTGWVLHWARFGDFERGRQIYRSRIRGVEFEGVCTAARRWEGQAIRGKTLHLIAGDIYLGDALQFVRFARVAKEAGATVIAQVPRRLRFLLRTIEGVDSVAAPYNPVPDGDYEMHAFWLLYSLSVPVEKMIGGAAYLESPAGLRAEWRERIPRLPGLNVGLVWHGSPWRIRDRYGRRSMPLEDLRPLASVPNIRLYSLQYGEGRTALLEADPPFPAIDLAPDLPNTCAAIEALDIIVTIDTGLAHLAGALGKRTFLMLPYDPCFRWMVDRDDTPWYRSVRLFRQSTPGEWSDVVAVVARALEQEPSGR